MSFIFLSNCKDPDNNLISIKDIRDNITVNK